MTSCNVGSTPPMRRRAQIRGMKESRIISKEDNDQDAGAVAFVEVCAIVI